MHYRPEVDGLRCIAVLTVIFFHAGIYPFHGGFIGVDVFFVISGYLITSLILAEQWEGRFSLLSFYMRRMRRIFPALFLTVFATGLAGWLILAPADLVELGRSTLGVTFFTSNFYFWKTTGYFDRAAELRPLLHTWSLSIEEQFYIVYPAVVVILARWKVLSLRHVVVATGLASLVLCIVLAHKAPIANFFLMPSRAWQLLLGATVAVFPTGSREGALAGSTTC